MLTDSNNAYTLEGRELLSQHCWNKKVLSHSSTLSSLGTHMASLSCSAAESTALCTCEHMHHPLLGQTLSMKEGLTYPEVLTLLQIRGNSYPAAAVVSCNKKGGVSSLDPAPCVTEMMKLYLIC